MKIKKIKWLLSHYLKGKVSQEERNLVDNWYQSFDEVPGIQLTDEAKEQVKEEIWNRIESRIDKRNHIWHRASTWFKAAAIIIPLVAGSAGVIAYLRDKPSVKKNETYSVFSTGIGQRKIITMQEGTVLNLNAGSTVRISDHLSKERKVEVIDGEVFFDVKRMPDVPFIIQSGPLTTRVLGTAFNISAYKNINTLSVAVTRGKVSVAEKQKSFNTLEKDQELIFSKRDGFYKIVPIEEGILEWRDGRLTLNDVSFDEMAVLMEKNFGIKITTNQHSIRTSRYTTQLLTSMKPMQAVEILAAIHHIKISGGNNHILFYE